MGFQCPPPPYWRDRRVIFHFLLLVFVCRVTQDKLLAGVSVGIGVLSLVIPLYYKFTIEDDV